MNIYQEHQGAPRESLQETLDDFIGQGKDVVIYRGLSKLLDDRCSFAAQTSADPVVVRQRLFEIASKAHQQGQFRREDIIGTVATELGLSADSIENIIYADLKQHHILQEFKPISAAMVLKRYNTALAQAILLKALSLKIEITEENHLRYRQLFRAIKFFRLLYQISGEPQYGFTILLDGPISLFQASQKYGLQMAMFLPALLHCNGWCLEAQLHWGQRKKLCYFRLDWQTGLYSHYPDTGVYRPPELEFFQERFTNLKSDWQIDTSCFFLEIGDQICIPDYIFTHQRNSTVVYLEIFGFWHKSALENRRKQIFSCGYNLLLAVSKKLKVDKPEYTISDKNFYFFHHVLNPKEVVEKIG